MVDYSIDVPGKKTLVVDPSNDGSGSSLNWNDRKNCGIFNLGRLAENTILLAGEQAKHDQYG